MKPSFSFLLLRAVTSLILLLLSRYTLSTSSVAVTSVWHDWWWFCVVNNGDDDEWWVRGLDGGFDGEVFSSFVFLVLPFTACIPKKNGDDGGMAIVYESCVCFSLRFGLWWFFYYSIVLSMQDIKMIQKQKHERRKNRGESRQNFVLPFRWDRSNLRFLPFWTYFWRDYLVEEVMNRLGCRVLFGYDICLMFWFFVTLLSFCACLISPYGFCYEKKRCPLFMLMMMFL